MLPTIVLVHGAWMSPASWQGWVDRYEARGYAVLAPAWPHDDRPVADLRARPAPELADVGVPEIVAHYEAVVRGLDQPPILVGHSFGGLFVQMLLDRGLGAAGVAIDPAPPKGVFPALDAIRASWPVVRTFGFARMVHTMAFEGFRWGWVHTLPETEQRAAWERYVVPTPGRPFAQAAAAPFGDALKVDFANDARAPLLLMAGTEDRTVTASMVRATYAKQKRSKAVTEYREYPGKTHWIVAQPGWEEVADDAVAWAEGQLGIAPAAAAP